MPILSWNISNNTRTNSLTATSVTVKKLTPSIDGEVLPHEYIFDGAVTDIDAKVSARADLEANKGYTITAEV